MSIPDAVAALERGELVAFPTETVYGLGADATNPEALRRLFQAKGRPADHPVIVHLGDATWLPRYAFTGPEAEALVEAFWPGPLTLILPRTPLVPLEATGGQDTVGLRMPDHPLALELLRTFGRPLAAPSANRFGRISPTTAEHVRQELGGSVSVILDGGPCRVGVESTILDLTVDPPALLRPGGVSATALDAVLGRGLGQTSRSRAPGTLKTHYAPGAPCRLVERATDCAGAAVLARRPNPGSGAVAWIQAPENPEGYARELYANLRNLDALAPPVILVEDVPREEPWSAVRDRLTRACQP